MNYKMPDPKNTNTGNFKVESILYDKNKFAIAIGTWKNKPKTLAMRWSGNNNKDKGYPKAFGYPMWFIIHDDLKQSIIQVLMQNDKDIVNEA